jgi:hypothetical protein
MQRSKVAEADSLVSERKSNLVAVRGSSERALYMIGRSAAHLSLPTNFWIAHLSCTGGASPDPIALSLSTLKSHKDGRPVTN